MGLENLVSLNGRDLGQGVRVKMVGRSLLKAVQYPRSICLNILSNGYSFGTTIPIICPKYLQNFYSFYK